MRLAGSGGKRRKARRKRKGLLVRDGTMIDWHKEGAKKTYFTFFWLGGAMERWISILCGVVALYY